MDKIIISPSLLAADFSRIGEQLRSLEDAGMTHLHLDVMDGIFVPNISFGIPVIKSLRKASNVLFDAHLMIDRPERYIRPFAAAGADAVTIHVEATPVPGRVLSDIRSLGMQAGLSLKPGTPLSEAVPYLPLCDRVLVMTVEPGFGGQSFMEDMVPKIQALSAYKAESGLSFEIQVDGGIKDSTLTVCVQAGAENLVAGSSVFGAPDPAKAFTYLSLSAQEALHGSTTHQSQSNN